MHKTTRSAGEPRLHITTANNAARAEDIRSRSTNQMLRQSRWKKTGIPRGRQSFDGLRVFSSAEPTRWVCWNAVYWCRAHGCVDGRRPPSDTDETRLRSAGETRCSPPPSAVSHQLQIQVELKSTKWAPSIQVKTSSRTLIARRLQRTTMSGSRG